MDSLFNLVQNLSASGTFLAVGLVFLVILVLSFILDGIFDAFDFGDGPLSLTTIGAFGAVFGFVGFAMKGFGLSTPTASLIGAVIGFVGAVGSWGLSLFFKKASTSASISAESVIGTLATVTLEIPGNGRAGEVSSMNGGLRNSWIAYSKKKIKSGEQVKILSLRGENSVNVEPVSAASETSKNSEI